MAGERFEVAAGGVTLAAERWPGEGVPVVLLHAGVADRRAWSAVAPRLGAPAVAYDRRGFGETPPTAPGFTHLADLGAVLDAIGEPAWLVGNSMGGALALDAALAMPERLAGLVLIAPAVSGQPEPDTLDEDSMRIIEPLIAAGQAGDVDAQLRLHAHLWLDGPAAEEGRVGGEARALALAMNEIVVRHDIPDEVGEAGIDAWGRLEEIALPTTVMWGDRDVPFGIATGEAIAARIPGARTFVLAGMAHLPALEDPAAVAAAIQESTAGR